MLLENEEERREFRLYEDRSLIRHCLGMLWRLEAEGQLMRIRRVGNDL